MRPRPELARILALAILCGAMPARAQQATGQSSPIVGAPGPNEQPNPNPSPAATGAFGALLSRNNLLGDPGGIGKRLADRGLTFGLTETSEVLGNVTGGTRRGADYDGSTLLGFGVDTEKAFGWKGGAFNVSALEIHGRNLSIDDLLSIQTASGIEAEPAFRLWELWFDQSFANGAADLKIGQQSVDQEFLTGTYTALFINTAMGFPAVPSYDLYSGGGPAYPLSSLGVRLRATRGPLTALAGIFDDNPPGGPFQDDDQRRRAERTGTAFNLGTGALMLAEVQYALNPAPADPHARPEGLPGTYRLGAWFDTASFPDQRYDADGRPLADPASSGAARMRRHDWSLYASADQQVWIDAQAVRSVGLFLRMMGAPGDRNFLEFSANGGVSLKAPFRGRPNDTFGVGLGVAKVGANVSGLDRDTRVLGGQPALPIRSTETFVEVTYQAQVAPWWQVQPDFQYVWMPGAGLPDPANPGGAATPRVGNEAVLGLRTVVTF